jgi:diguanylate cyclase (GGDEF)-like protein
MYAPPASVRCASRWMALAVLAAACFGTAAHAAPAAGAGAGKPDAAEVLAQLRAEVDTWVSAGFDQPDAALRELARRTAAAPPGGDAWRVALLGRGLVAGSNGLTAEAEAAASALGGPEAALVRAALADGRIASDAALLSAQDVLDGCETARPACDYRTLWQARMILVRQLRVQGKATVAQDHALRAAELAAGARDNVRQTVALAQATLAAGQSGEWATAQQHWEQAQQLAALDGSPMLQARVALFESAWHAARGNAPASRQAIDAGLLQARRAGSPRLEAMLLANLADAHVRGHEPLRALAATARALPELRRHGDVRTERIALANAGLARIQLHQFAAASAVLEELLAAHEATGAAADQATALREFGDAYAAEGELAAALALYHRERALAERITQANREAALAELHRRFDPQAEQRQLDQLARENALMGAQLENRAATQGIWAASAAALALAGALLALLVQRMRVLNRDLVRKQAALRAQGQRDPLTGLANRHALHEVLAADGRVQALEGALILVDVDRFKSVNDRHGHAAGDAVLLEVAHRLAAVVRDDDLVVRWGGEEFLIYTPRVTPQQAQALARRTLFAVGETPVTLPGGAPLHITASAGYGVFPLSPARLPLSLQRALNLADRALYTAKNEGRNRAVGVVAAQAADDAELRRMEAGFEAAWESGRLTLQRSGGPPTALAAAPSAVAAMPAA